MDRSRSWASPRDNGLWTLYNGSVVNAKVWRGMPQTRGRGLGRPDTTRQAVSDYLTFTKKPLEDSLGTTGDMSRWAYLDNKRYHVDATFSGVTMVLPPQRLLFLGD